MALGNYRNPSELKDEDKWFRFFTKPQLIILAAALIISLQILVILAKLGLFALGFFFFIVIMAGAFVGVMCKMPDEKYLLAAGEKLGIIAIRIIRKKIFGKKIYTKNYDEGME